jgi:RNA polymerase sigma-70 factor (ECF subfamily)
VWAVLGQAHAGPPEAAARARQWLFDRYGGAVYRYLRRILGDAHAAEDLTQEFAMSLVRGAFHRADPRHGRFRQYVKRVLHHLVSNYRRQQNRLQTLPPDSPELATLPIPPEDADEPFRQHWRDELLARAWDALARARPAYYTVLRLCADHPRMASAEMARHLSLRQGKPITPEGVRQNLHRARNLFADLLLEEVAQSLEPLMPEPVVQELAELDLLDYCRPALGRRFPNLGSQQHLR